MGRQKSKRQGGQVAPSRLPVGIQPAPTCTKVCPACTKVCPACTKVCPTIVKSVDRITARARYTDTPGFQGQDGRSLGRDHSGEEKYGALRRGGGGQK